jgi:uncharacterized membrane protein
MRLMYLAAVWIHILTVAVWIGAMFFEDPHSIRLASRIVDRMHGMGWYAQGVLWATGLFMLHYRGIGPAQLFSADLIASPWGRAMWAKIALVLLLAVFQATVGHKPSKLVYGYIVGAFIVVGISVTLVRPGLF